MAVATWQDVAIALGRPLTDFTADQQAQIAYWLAGIELLIAARLGDVTLLDQQALQFVETEAAAEKVRRAGTTESSISVSVDDATVTRRYENKVTGADITDEWWNLLDGGSTGIFSVRPGFEPDTPDLTSWA